MSNIIWQSELDRVEARRRRQREELLRQGNLVDEQPIQVVSPEVSVVEVPISTVEPVVSISEQIQTQSDSPESASPATPTPSDVVEPQAVSRSRRGRPRKTKPMTDSTAPPIV